jgi:hypothetical protein
MALQNMSLRSACSTDAFLYYKVKTSFLGQYSETNVMHFLFSLLRINGLYRFRALLAHPQEVLHKCHLVYCVWKISPPPGFNPRTVQPVASRYTNWATQPTKDIPKLNCTDKFHYLPQNTKFNWNLSNRCKDKTCRLTNMTCYWAFTYTHLWNTDTTKHPACISQAISFKTTAPNIL